MSELSCEKFVVFSFSKCNVTETLCVPIKVLCSASVTVGLRFVFQVQAALGLVLSVFRYDSLFDYSGELEDPLAREVVYKHHCKLVKKIQPKLERRNKRRFHEGHLTYPYLLPRWLPNGVQT